ncbi:MAG: hypothetical protein ABI430_00655 [Candidatus Taylorbacteria bacterium]
MKTKKGLAIGFIGQGWIGKHYADDFEKRGYEVVRYAKEEPYIGNKKEIGKCDIVFIAVPTPTTPKGFSDSIVQSVLPLVGQGKIAVIKSSLLPGRTEALQKKFPRISIVHSPEFLREVSAAFDAENPRRNIVGIPKDTKAGRAVARKVLSVLPQAPYSTICSAREAEFIKYAGNCFLFTKVVYTNILYDLARELGISWKVIQEAMGKDPRIGESHLDPIHGKGRGAGGHCFIKDFSAFASFHDDTMKSVQSGRVLRELEKKNIELLKSTAKDIELLREVYGE